MAKKGVDLPLHQDSASAFLPWVIGLMLYVIALAGTFAIALSFYIESTAQTKTGQLTLQIPVSSSQPQAQIEASVVETLKKFPKILSVRPVSAQQVQATAQPWLEGTQNGNPGEISEALSALPFPILIDITFSGTSPEMALDFSKELQKAFPDASVIMHNEWLEHLTQWFETLEWIAWFSAGLFLTVALLAVAFAVRTGVVIHAPIVEVLDLMGASESYISRQFQKQTLKTISKSFLFAAFLLVSTFIFFQLFLEGANFSFPFTKGFYQRLALLFVAIPLLSGALILAMTRLMVIFSLRHPHFKI